MNKIIIRTSVLVFLVLLFAIGLFGQPFPPSAVGGSSVLACVGTPGDTTGAYRQQCQTTGGALYACNNAVGCTVAVDWVGATAGFAPLNSPAFIGAPTVPTPTTGDNSGAIPNTTFLNNAVAAAASSSIPGTSYPANQPNAGCGVEPITGTLQFAVGACNYSINGVAYSSPAVTLTASAADATNPRIDNIIVDLSSTASIQAGTPAGTPAAPSIDPATQLQLTFYTVAANATAPSNVTTDNMYDENTEWACNPTAHLNCASTNNPYRGTKDIEATAAVLNNNFTLIKPASGTVDLGTRNAQIFYIRSKAQWPVGASGSTAARYLSIWFQNGGNQKGSQVVLRDGTFGFSSANTTTYQQISIPTALFGINGIPVTTFKAQVSGPSGSSSIGFYIDAVSLQGGLGAPALPATVMNFRGAWSSNTAYNPNDTVVSNGIAYVALIANTNVAVTTTATWTSTFPSAVPNGTIATTQSANSNDTKLATDAYVDGIRTTCTAPQFLISTTSCSTPVLTQNSQSAAYTTVLGDAGKMILHPSSDNNARTFTIDSNANVAYPVGTCITFVNMINTVTIAITSDTMTFMGSNTTGSRTLAVGNWATACKIASTSWVIGGSLGLT